MANNEVMTSDKQPGFFYGYIIVIAGFLTMMLVFGAQYSFGVFFKPMLAEFGWTRAVTSGAYSLNLGLQGFGAIVVGGLCDRFGPRLVVLVSGFFIGLGYLLMSQINAIWQIYLLYGAFLGIGSAGIFVTVLSTVAKWFVTKRGTATGIVVSGVGVGTIIIPPLANQLISSYSWRTSYIIIGLIALVVIGTSAQFLRRAPIYKKASVEDGNAVKKESADSQAQGLSLQEAVRNRQFWIGSLMFLCAGFFAQMIMVHLVPYATDIGISATAAATLISAVGWVSIMGKIGLGNAGDRLGNRRAMMIVFVLMLVAFLWLQLGSQLWMLYLFAAVFAIGYGGEVALRSPLVAEYFGLRAHGSIFGLLQLVSAGIGSSIGPFVAGRIFDVTGSYYWAFILCAIISLAGLMLSIALKVARKQDVGRQPRYGTTS